MEKIINIDVKTLDDLVEKYDNDKIAQDLLEYIIKEARHLNRKDTLKINIILNFKTNLNIKEMLTTSFKEEYLNTVNDHYFNNLFQVILFLLGILFLSLSALLKDNNIWKELFLIGGWVPIWEMIELELFNDVRGRKKKFIINKILNSSIDIRISNAQVKYKKGDY